MITPVRSIHGRWVHTDVLPEHGGCSSLMLHCRGHTNLVFLSKKEISVGKRGSEDLTKSFHHGWNPPNRHGRHSGSDMLGGALFWAQGCDAENGERMDQTLLL